MGDIGKQGFEKHQIVGRSIAYHRFSDFLDLNKSQVDANMKNWQIYGNLNFCDYIY
jgi:hypothetical protein